MSIFSKFRLPYRDDKLFGVLFLIALLVPLAFDVYNFESFEIVKFGLFILLTGFGPAFFLKKINRQSYTIALRLNKSVIFGLVFFILWCFFSSLFSVDWNYSFFGFYPRFTNGFLFYFAWVILFFLLSAIEIKQLWFLIKVLFFCSFLIGIWGLAQSVGWGYYIGQTFDLFTRSAPSFLGNPNFSSMFIVGAVPLGGYFFYISEKFWHKVYYSTAVFIQIWAVIIFSSRGAILALGAGFCAAMLLILFARKSFNFKKSAFIFFASFVLLVVLTAGFLKFSRPGTVLPTLNLTEYNIQQRFGVWKVSIYAIKKNPVFGYGLGNFELAFENFRQISNTNKGRFDDPHNLFLMLAVTGGIPLLAAFLFIIIYPLISGIKKALASSQNEAFASAVLFGGIVAWVVAASFTPVAIACYILLAFLLSAFLPLPAPYKTGAAVRVGLKATGLVLVIFAVCFLTAEHLFFAGVKSYNNNNFGKGAALVKASTVLNPGNSIYFEYLAGNAIRANMATSTVNGYIEKFQKFHPLYTYHYILQASLNYLLLYQTQDLAYKGPILNNLNKAISLDPYSESQYLLLAQYQVLFGDIEGSITNINKGLSLDPGDVEARMLLVKLYQLQNNREMFFASLNQAIKFSPDKTQLLELLKFAKKVDDIRKVQFIYKLTLGTLD